MYSSAVFFLLYAMMIAGYPVAKFLMMEIQNLEDDPLLTRDMMVMDDIQTHYESVVDEVISSHSEDFLLSMTWSMSKEKMNTVYRPQISMLLLNHPTIHDKCLYRVPHWIGKYLHDMHSKSYEMVAPKVQNYMAAHWPSSRWYPTDVTTSDIAEFLASLNHALLPTTTIQMDPTLALTHLGHQLQMCQQKQQDDHRWSLGFLLWGKLFGHIQQPLPSSYDLNGSMKHHFLVKFLVDMRSDLVTQMHDRVADLIPLIQDDLHDRFVDV